MHRVRPADFSLTRFASALAFLYIPMAFSGYWSFTEFNGLIAPKWVGLENYTTLFQDALFLKSLWNTVLFVIFGMSIGPALGLGPTDGGLVLRRPGGAGAARWSVARRHGSSLPGRPRHPGCSSRKY